MEIKTFKAMVVEAVNQEVVFDLRTITVDDLSQGDVLIEVAYSSVNYKDMLATQKNGGVIRNYPMIPGIDLAGTVVESSHPDFQVGQEVIATNYDIGVSHTGGYAQYARLPHDWILPLPDGLSLKDAMVLGTAGLTAALSVQALVDAGLQKENKPRILVTGASGGVGSCALSILKTMGFEEIGALVRKDYQRPFVEQLGATSLFSPEEMMSKPRPVLLKRRFDYILDTVGGDLAASLLAQLENGGAMTLCGNAGGISLNTTVMPFILRGIKLLGIDASGLAMSIRRDIWQKLSKEWAIAQQISYDEIELSDLPETMQALKEGSHLGRTLVRISQV